MTKRDQNSRARTRARGKQSEPNRLRTYALMIVCAMVLISGFFFAARQHFSSMDYGMKNSRLQKQVDELEAEKRRLLLAREVTLSPAEIKKAMRRTGFAEYASTTDEVAQVAAVTREKATPAPAAPKTKGTVIKTAAVAPASPNIDAVYAKVEKIDKAPKRLAAVR